MSKGVDEVLLSFISVTLVLGVLAGFIVSFAFLFQRRQAQFRQEKRHLQETYQRELLQSQLEIQNQTLQQIAEELHDHIGQLLTVAILRLDALEDEVADTGAQQSVQQTQKLVRTIIDDVRALTKTLDYSTVQQFGLLASLKFELERIQRMGRVRTEVVTAGDEYSLGEQAETVVLRMVQEAINNALKHARARNLTLVVEYQPETFILTITDDGRGFVVTEAVNRPLDRAGAGLQNLHRRAILLGGACTVMSQPGEGTRVTIQLPRYRAL